MRRAAGVHQHAEARVPSYTVDWQWRLTIRSNVQGSRRSCRRAQVIEAEAAIFCADCKRATVHGLQRSSQRVPGAGKWHRAEYMQPLASCAQHTQPANTAGWPVQSEYASSLTANRSTACVQLQGGRKAADMLHQASVVPDIKIVETASHLP